MDSHIGTKRVKVRKERQCFGCLRIFASGTEMEKTTSVQDCRFCHCYLCAVCEKYCAEIMGSEMFGEGELKECDPGEWEVIRKEVEGVGEFEVRKLSCLR